MTKKIWLDCDGTWIDLYGVDNWLADLCSYNPRPYKEAKPLIHLSTFARTIHELQAQGWEVNIVTWLSKNSNEVYDKAVAKTKLDYFKKHLPSVEFNQIKILKYGTPKSSVGDGILFDDEEKNRNEWKGIACTEKNLIKKMRVLLK